MPDPAVLYKYLPPARVDVLQNLKIRFAQVSALNDPFESLPGVTLEHDDWYRAYYQRRIDKELLSLSHLSRQERRAHERSRWKGFGHFLNCYTDKKWLSELSETVQRMGDTVHGILSLSANCTNILMWSHYSLNHTGFVLGFDAQHEYFGRSVSPVTYSRTRPKINPFEAKHSGELFYTKSLDWEYEQEYRKFMEFVAPEPLENGSQLLPFEESGEGKSPNSELRLFPFPPDSIRCVVLGWKSSSALREEISAALHAHKLTDVPLMKALPSLTEYKMDIA